MARLPVFCGKDCGGKACPLIADVEQGRVTRIRHNPVAGRTIRGCPRGFALPLETYAPERLLTPLIRTGPRGSGQFRETSWNEALAVTVRSLEEIRTRFGPEAVLAMNGFGSIGALHATSALLNRFLNLSGGCTRLTGNYSNGAAMFTLPYLLGRDWLRSGFDAATMRHAEMIVLWGANVLETRMGAETPARLLEAKRRGARIVAIGPRRSYTAQRTGAWWIPCRPGTDAALMLAILHVLITENLADRSFIGKHSVGFPLLERYVLGLEGGRSRTPDWAAGICGVAAREIIRFARAYAAAKPVLLFPGFAIQRVFAGEEPYRLTVALQIATGNFGLRGGSTGSMNQLLPCPKVGRLDVPPLASQASVPVVRWPDAIIEGRAGGYPSDVRAIYNLGGNLLNQGADIRKGVAAFAMVDFAVSHEFFLTSTARHCDVIFPAATALEKEDIGLPWAGNYLLYKPAVSARLGQARSDYDALWELADRMGFGAAFSEGRTASQWIDLFIAQSDVPDPEAFRRSGIYLAPEQERTGLAAFAADPEGFPLDTPSGKVEIASLSYARDTGFPAIPTWQTPPRDGRLPLRLISPKSRHYTHSQSNLPPLRGRRPHALTMNPLDAAQRGIAGGDVVRISNDRGEGIVTARLSREVMPGVVILPEGIWMRLDGNGVDRAGAANLFTSTRGTAPAKANIMHGMAVEVVRA
jgi:anaerobic dimethyl sulfoxide reductase subunit A